MSAPVGYSNVAEELKRRIIVLIPAQPQILGLSDAWALFKVPGFDCSDLGPSLYQASWALAAAKAEFRAAAPPGGQDG